MCVQCMVYTGCNKGGVTVSVVRGYEAAALLPWSSPRILDFHCFESAVRHFCFAYHHRFSPSHFLPCLALSVLWAVITSHYIFSFVVFDQSNELYPADEIGSVSSSFSQKDDSKLQLFWNKSDYQTKEKYYSAPSHRKDGGWRMFVNLIYHSSLRCLSQAMRLKEWSQPDAPYTPLLSTETTELFITFSRVKDHAWLVNVYMAARK